MRYEYDKIYILIYFFYGLAFFTMGISILQNRVEKKNSFLLLKSMKFLGLFGLTHGITEWIIMINIANIYAIDRRALNIMSVIFNSISFAFLFYFGIILLDFKGNFKKFIRYIPITLFIIWCLGVFISLWDHEVSEHLYPVLNILSRYFIGLTGSIFAAIALNRNTEFLKLLELDKIAKRIKGLAISFFVYGILAGLFVRKTKFFPSNIINSDLFYDITGIPVEVARAITAIIITILSVSIIDLFRWVNQQKIERLTNLEFLNNERRRLCQNLHDVIIQNIFATGLKLETILEKETDEVSLKKNIIEVKDNLNDTIAQIREVINSISTKKIDIDGLNTKITDLVAEQNKRSELDIQYYFDSIDIAYNYSFSEKLAEIYYIVQEALLNAIKHSNADKIVITLTIDLQYIQVIIFDNGKGFDSKIKSKGGYGLTSMSERTLTIGGELSMKSGKNGTEINLIVLWRVDK